jgi:hypothetical protein
MMTCIAEYKLLTESEADDKAHYPVAAAVVGAKAKALKPKKVKRGEQRMEIDAQRRSAVTVAAARPTHADVIPKRKVDSHDLDTAQVFHSSSSTSDDS